MRMRTFTPTHALMGNPRTGFGTTLELHYAVHRTALREFYL